MKAPENGMTLNAESENFSEGFIAETNLKYWQVTARWRSKGCIFRKRNVSEGLYIEDSMEAWNAMLEKKRKGGIIKTGVVRFSRIFGTMLMNSSSLSHSYKPSPPLPSREFMFIYIQNTYRVYFFLSIIRPLLWIRACILDYVRPANIYLNGNSIFLELLPFLGSLVSFPKPSSGPGYICFTRMSLLARRRMNTYLLNEVNTYLNHLQLSVICSLWLHLLPIPSTHHSATSVPRRKISCLGNRYTVFIQNSSVYL